MNRKLNLALLCIGIIILAAATATAQTNMVFGIKGGLAMTNQSTEVTGAVATVRDMYIDEPAASLADDYSSSSLTGMQFGAFLTINIGTSFAFQPELIYTQKGIKVEGEGTWSGGGEWEKYTLTEEIKLTYLEIPLLAKFRIPTQGSVKPSLFVGPCLAINISGNEDLSLVYKDSDDDTGTFSGKPDINNLKSSDIGLVFGGDLRIGSGPTSFVLDLRYTMGTGEVYESVDPDSIPEINPEDPFPADFPVAHYDTGVASDAKNGSFSFSVGVAFAL